MKDRNDRVRGVHPASSRACIQVCAMVIATFLSGQAAAELQVRPGGMVYDSHNDVTYLANPIYESKKYQREVLGQENPTGRMTLQQARDFVSQLNYGGYDDWRLPKAGLFDNLYCRGGGGICSTSEIGHLWPELAVPRGGTAIFCSPLVRTESGNDRDFQPSAWENCEGRFYYPPSSAPPLIDTDPLFTVATCKFGDSACWFWSEYPVTYPYYPILNYYGTQSTVPHPDYLIFVWPVRSGDVATVTDLDEDGMVDSADNCPAAPNPDQTDNDADGQGDVCDGDDDNDGYVDGADNCRLVANATQADSDSDGIGDVCDGDRDGDELENGTDNCPSAANPDQTDTDGDGLGDECDLNDDGDSYPDASDNCPAVPNNDQEDLDGDSIGDFCDSDLDGDGAGNETDNCPLDANVGQDDADGDRAGDACDTDDDNDGVGDATDNCPLMVNVSQGDQDGDSLGDVCDGDLDGDGAANGVDNCPVSANPDQRDFDVDALGDACDPDADGDGVANGGDSCAWSTAGQVVDATGCSIAQLSPCSGPAGTVMPWRNKGKYVSSVAHSAKRFAEGGLISTQEQAEIVATAGASTCGQ